MIDVLYQMLKHMPGKHNQQLHAPHQARFSTIERTRSGRLNISATIEETARSIAPPGAEFTVDDVANSIQDQGVPVVERSTTVGSKGAEEQIGKNQIRRSLDGIAKYSLGYLKKTGKDSYYRYASGEPKDWSERERDITAWFRL